MSEELKQKFLKMVELQAINNRMMHGDDKDRTLQEWALIAGEHMGHLAGVVNRENRREAEKEILHVAAPLLELFIALFPGQ